MHTIVGQQEHMLRQVGFKAVVTATTAANAGSKSHAATPPPPPASATTGGAASPDTLPAPPPLPTSPSSLAVHVDLVADTPVVVTATPRAVAALTAANANLAAHRQRTKYQHLRPRVPLLYHKDDPDYKIGSRPSLLAWWRYAFTAVLEGLKDRSRLSRRLDFAAIVKRAQRRQRHNNLYRRLLLARSFAAAAGEAEEGSSPLAATATTDSPPAAEHERPARSGESEGGDIREKGGEKENEEVEEDREDGEDGASLVASSISSVSIHTPDQLLQGQAEHEGMSLTQFRAVRESLNTVERELSLNEIILYRWTVRLELESRGVQLRAGSVEAAPTELRTADGTASGPAAALERGPVGGTGAGADADAGAGALDPHDVYEGFGSFGGGSLWHALVGEAVRERDQARESGAAPRRQSRSRSRERGDLHGAAAEDDDESRADDSAEEDAQDEYKDKDADESEDEDDEEEEEEEEDGEATSAHALLYRIDQLPSSLARGVLKVWRHRQAVAILRGGMGGVEEPGSGGGETEDDAGSGGNPVPRGHSSSTLRSDRSWSASERDRDGGPESAEVPYASTWSFSPTRQAAACSTVPSPAAESTQRKPTITAELRMCALMFRLVTDCHLDLRAGPDQDHGHGHGQDHGHDHEQDQEQEQGDTEERDYDEDVEYFMGGDGTTTATTTTVNGPARRGQNNGNLNTTKTSTSAANTHADTTGHANASANAHEDEHGECILSLEITADSASALRDHDHDADAIRARPTDGKLPAAALQASVVMFQGGGGGLESRVSLSQVTLRGSGGALLLRQMATTASSTDSTKAPSTDSSTAPSTAPSTATPTAPTPTSEAASTAKPAICLGLSISPRPDLTRALSTTAPDPASDFDPDGPLPVQSPHPSEPSPAQTLSANAHADDSHPHAAHWDVAEHTNSHVQDVLAVRSVTSLDIVACGLEATWHRPTALAVMAISSSLTAHSRALGGAGGDHGNGQGFGRLEGDQRGVGGGSEHGGTPAENFFGFPRDPVPLDEADVVWAKLRARR